MGSAWSSFLAPSSTDAQPSLEFYSPRIAKMVMERTNNPGMDKVESEVEASKVTWSELSPNVVVGVAGAVARWIIQRVE